MEVSVENDRSLVFRRAGAFLFDYFLTVFTGTGAAFLIYGDAFFEPNNSHPIIASTGIMLALFFCRDLVKGISPGRWVTGIMVRDYDFPSQPPSIPNRILRNIMLIAWPVEIITMIFNSELRRLGDRAAHAMVMVNPQSAQVVWRLIPVILMVVLFYGSGFFLQAYLVKRTEPYNVSVEYIKSNTEVQQLTGGVTGFGTLPSGTMTVTNNYGYAEFIIPVKGSTKDAVAYVTLQLKDGKWVVTKSVFK
jgi:hypothetical protein